MFDLSREDELLGDIDYPAFDERLNSTIFIVREILSDKKTYKHILCELYDYMKQGFEQERVRKHPLKFRFKNDEREPIKTMEVRHFIINLMYWYPFLYLEIPDHVNDSHIFDGYKFCQKYSDEYVNSKIVIPYRKQFRMEDISAARDDMIFLLTRINYDFAEVMGTTMDIEAFSDLRERYPKFKELTERRLAEGIQPKEIEDILSNDLKTMVKIITEDDNNLLKPFIASGKGLNLGQLSQFAINGGLKPDVEGNVIPIPINSSYIHRGLDSVSNFYIDGQAGCKPLIMNKTVMGRSGHFAYKTMQLSSSYRMSQTVDDCHSSRPIKYYIADKEHLKRANNRYIVLEDGSYHIIDYRTDDHLIGQTVLMRDPITCCAHDGICHVCYGDLYYTNCNPNFHIGKFAATKINNPIQQKILSTKHMNSTHSDLIEFDESFYKFFILDSSTILLNPDSDEDFDKWELLISTDDYFVLDEVSTDSDFNYSMERFYIGNRSTGTMIPITDKGNHDIFLYGDIAQLLKKKDDYLAIKLSNIDFGNPIAKVNIHNNEMSTPLKNIVKLLDRVPHLGCTTIDEILNKMCDLTIESGIDVDVVHCSLLIKGLVRKADDILLEPNWKDPDTCENYQILRVTDALIYNPSLALSISFEYMNKQITSPYTYRKYKKSEYDLHFKESIYMDSKRYYKEQKARKKKRKRDKEAKKWMAEMMAKAKASKV